VPDRWTEGWKAFCGRNEAAAGRGTSLQPFDRDKVGEIREILGLLPRLLAWQGDSLMRFASSLLCGDSKRLEQLQRKLEACIAPISGGEIKTLADKGITQNERSLLLHGPLKLEFEEAWIDLGVFAGPVRIDRRDIDRAVFHAKPGRCVTVENAAMLHEMCKLRSGTILASSGSEGGFAHSAIITFLTRLPPEIECWHFGDSDPKGFDILRDLRERSRRTIGSLHMQFRDSLSAPPLAREDIATIDRLLASEFLTNEEKAELREIRASGRKGLFEQEALGLPASEWPFFTPRNSPH
jgi:hypothetical protein